ncbi:MAG: DUF3794 domain-containing protein [Clostridiales bacterium]|jgi:hypothetical protein|nr:DUF3794 domain-containing protein [Clostridiales bacterium]
MEIGKGNIVLDRKIGKENTQALYEGDIIVPDIKPDIAVILSTDSNVIIDRVDVGTDRINYTGKLAVNILYLARGAQKLVHSMHVSHAIDDFINMDGVTKDAWAEVVPAIENIDFKIINDRKIGYRAVVNFDVGASITCSHEVVTTIGGINENQLLKTPLKLNRSVVTKTDTFTVKDEISIPAGKPNIRELLQYNVSVGNKDVRVGNGKININGELAVTCLYKGDEDESLIEFVETDIPFNGQIDAPESREDMFADVKTTIMDPYIQIRPDADGEDRMLDLEITIQAVLKISVSENIEILEDAYCINQNIDIKREPVKYSKPVCRNRNQSPIKEVIQLDSTCPDILQIFRVKGKAGIDEVKIVDDKVIAEGVINCDVLYIAGSDETPLYSYKYAVPFRQVIETKGARPGCEVHVEASVEHAGFNMLSDREVELRFLLCFNTSVSEELECSMITDIEFTEMDKEQLDKMPSMIIYVVQQGDTLWKIAKKYNTTIDELSSINEIDSPSKIYAGQKFLVLKRCEM